MEAVRTDWVARNEYTRPLEGQPCYRSCGIIYALDRYDGRYAVAQIDYERFDEQNFQYVFSPEWAVIDALPPSIFQGIPGLDLSMRLERYYRVNMTPVFIAERTPGKGREELWELLESVGMDYYDRFEWLLRTDMRCGTDNLIVERANPEKRTIPYMADQTLPSNLGPKDCIVLHSLQDVASSGRELSFCMIRILRSGAQVFLEAERQTLSNQEKSAMLRLLLMQAILEEKQYQKKRSEGIEEAKKTGKYAGRKRIAVDRNLLEEIAGEFENHRITEEEAMRRLGIGSRSTFYRRLKEMRG